LWGHGYKRIDGFDPEKRISDRMRAFFIRNSDAILLYSDETKSEMQSKFPGKAFYVARNSIQSEDKEKKYQTMEAVGKKYYRKKHKCNYDLNLAYVARITRNKKVELLINLAEIIKSITDTPFLIHVIGDGEDRAVFESEIKNRNMEKYFRVYGEVYDEELTAEIIYLSDVLVIPAWLGLSVNHSFCYGTPVATLVNERHPPEISFVHDKNNGFLCSDLQDMAKRIVNAVENEETIKHMSDEAREYFCKYLGIKSMYKGFLDAMRFVLSK